MYTSVETGKESSPGTMNTVSIRAASLLAGASLALMAVLAPLGLMIALPAGAVGVTATVVLLIAVLDVFVAVGLYPVLRPAGVLLAASASGLRLAYAAVFAAAAGSLAGRPDIERFEAVWEMGLFVFAWHLLLVGIAGVRADAVPSWVGAGPHRRAGLFDRFGKYGYRACRPSGHRRVRLHRRSGPAGLATGMERSNHDDLGLSGTGGTDGAHGP